MILGAECVSGGDIPNTNDCSDVTRVTSVDVLAFVSLDLNESADALTLAGAGIKNGVPFAQFSGIHTEENQLSYERITPELEG